MYAREGLLDFDVIMVLFEFLLRTDAGRFAGRRRDGVTHWIADEFQDTNLPQLLALKCLAGHTHHDDRREAGHGCR